MEALTKALVESTTDWAKLRLAERPPSALLKVATRSFGGGDAIITALEALPFYDGFEARFSQSIHSLGGIKRIERVLIQAGGVAEMIKKSLGEGLKKLWGGVQPFLNLGKALGSYSPPLAAFESTASIGCCKEPTRGGAYKVVHSDTLLLAVGMFVGLYLFDFICLFVGLAWASLF